MQTVVLPKGDFLYSQSTTGAPPAIELFGPITMRATTAVPDRVFVYSYDKLVISVDAEDLVILGTDDEPVWVSVDVDELVVMGRYEVEFVVDEDVVDLGPLRPYLLASDILE